MKSKRRVVKPLSLLSFLILLPAFAQDTPLSLEDLLNSAPWRQIGPASFGGRISDVEAVAGNPEVIFVGAASGGIFRSRNNGITWEPVFDEEAALLSIGDLAIAPSDPGIVWAGTGEPNNRQSSPWGNGVYRSLDGGDSWQHMGLEESRHIGRVVIDPRDPDTVFVAALGHLWGPNPERGLYRTRDGGENWERVLAVSDDTGVVEVAMESNGRVLYAAAYQRRRRGWGFVGGGPESGLYRSLDGGDTWTKLTQGLPDGDTGRIGVSISASRPNIVYAIVENKNGGVFRSEDRGSNWTRVNELNPRPMYYSQIRVDPANPDKVWVLGSPLFVSIDGGKNFTSDRTGVKIHVDHHALWINPSDPDHLVLGNDGGLYLSYDSARNWQFVDNLPIGQYYQIGLDRRDPYWVYGGTQDNGTWAIPSRTHSQLGITNNHVVNIAYGDGFYAAVDPRDHRLVFAESQNGRLYFVDQDTFEEKGIAPVPADPEEEYRFNWNAPLLISPHDPDVLYYGGNKLFRSSDRGHGWREISPDLTRNQKWKELPIMGLVRSDDTLSRDDGTAHFGTLTTVSESPLQAGLILVGTDDGVVQMTGDGGREWTDLSRRFDLPEPRWVSRVVASRHRAEVAYVTFDGHQDDDYTPYVFKTEDSGRSWTRISGDLPDGVVVNALAEHHRNPDLLFAGTESGLAVTVNGGRNWVVAGGNLPAVPVDDLIVEERANDLVLGTHGRSIIVLDDLAFLETLGPSVLDRDFHLFPVREARQYYEHRELPVPGASEFSGPNPPFGAILAYTLTEDLQRREERHHDEESETAGEHGEDAHDDTASSAEKPAAVRIVIEDQSGKTVRELEGPATRGMHRVAWDLRYPLSYTPAADESGWFGPPRGPFVLPGTYQVRIEVGGQSQTQSVDVSVDPLAETSPAALQARFEASTTVNERLGTFDRAASTVRRMDEELARIREKLKDGNTPESVEEAVEGLGKKLEELKEYFKSGWRSEKFKLLDLLGQLQASTSKPTEAQLRSLEQLGEKLAKRIAEVNALATESFPDLLQKLSGSGVQLMSFEPIEPPEGL